MYSQYITLGVLILLSAIFSGSETALISISNSKVDELVQQKKRNSKVLKKLKADPHKLLITVLIGNNIVNVASSVYAGVILSEAFGSAGVGVATAVMTFLLLVFGEITPKSFCHQHAEAVSLLIARPIYVLKIILYPLVWFFDQIVRLTNKMFGSNDRISVTEGEIVAMLNIGAKEGSIEKQEKELIENVLEFNDIEVEDVMTPRVVLDALNVEMTIQEAVDFAIKHTHSRLPVYKDDLDNIIGIISIKQLLHFFDHYSPRKKLKSLELSHPLEVPLSKKINTLFREFQRKHQHMAVVIDEHGGTAGIVTMEDLLEEIVGDIVDEFDDHEKSIDIIDNKSIYALGETLMEDINDYFREKIGPSDHDTLNMFLQDYLHRFPRKEEVINLPSVRIKIMKMKKNLIGQAKITKKRVRKKA